MRSTESNLDHNNVAKSLGPSRVRSKQKEMIREIKKNKLVNSTHISTEACCYYPTLAWSNEKIRYMLFALTFFSTVVTIYFGTSLYEISKVALADFINEKYKEKSGETGNVPSTINSAHLKDAESIIGGGFASIFLLSLILAYFFGLRKYNDNNAIDVENQLTHRVPDNQNLDTPPPHQHYNARRLFLETLFIEYGNRFTSKPSGNKAALNVIIESVKNLNDKRNEIPTLEIKAIRNYKNEVITSIPEALMQDLKTWHLQDHHAYYHWEFANDFIHFLKPKMGLGDYIYHDVSRALMLIYFSHHETLKDNDNVKMQEMRADCIKQDKEIVNYLMHHVGFTYNTLHHESIFNSLKLVGFKPFINGGVYKKAAGYIKKPGDLIDRGADVTAEILQYDKEQQDLIATLNRLLEEFDREESSAETKNKDEKKPHVVTDDETAEYLRRVLFWENDTLTSDERCSILSYLTKQCIGEDTPANIPLIFGGVLDNEYQLHPKFIKLMSDDVIHKKSNKATKEATSLLTELIKNQPAVASQLIGKMTTIQLKPYKSVFDSLSTNELKTLLNATSTKQIKKCVLLISETLGDSRIKSTAMTLTAEKCVAAMVASQAQSIEQAKAERKKPNIILLEKTRLAATKALILEDPEQLFAQNLLAIQAGPLKEAFILLVANSEFDSDDKKRLVNPVLTSLSAASRYQLHNNLNVLIDAKKVVDAVNELFKDCLNPLPKQGYQSFEGNHDDDPIQLLEPTQKTKEKLVETLADYLNPEDIKQLAKGIDQNENLNVDIHLLKCIITHCGVSYKKDDWTKTLSNKLPKLKEIAEAKEKYAAAKNIYFHENIDITKLDQLSLFDRKEKNSENHKKIHLLQIGTHYLYLSYIEKENEPTIIELFDPNPFHPFYQHIMARLKKICQEKLTIKSSHGTSLQPKIIMRNPYKNGKMLGENRNAITIMARVFFDICCDTQHQPTSNEYQCLLDIAINRFLLSNPNDDNQVSKDLSSCRDKLKPDFAVIEENRVFPCLQTLTRLDKTELTRLKNSHYFNHEALPDITDKVNLFLTCPNKSLISEVKNYLDTLDNNRIKLFLYEIEIQTSEHQEKCRSIEIIILNNALHSNRPDFMNTVLTHYAESKTKIDLMLDSLSLHAAALTNRKQNTETQLNQTQYEQLAIDFITESKKAFNQLNTVSLAESFLIYFPHTALSARDLSMLFNDFNEDDISHFIDYLEQDASIHSYSKKEVWSALLFQLTVILKNPRNLDHANALLWHCLIQYNDGEIGDLITLIMSSGAEQTLAEKYAIGLIDYLNHSLDHLRNTKPATLPLFKEEDHPLYRFLLFCATHHGKQKKLLLPYKDPIFLLLTNNENVFFIPDGLSEEEKLAFKDEHFAVKLRLLLSFYKLESDQVSVLARASKKLSSFFQFNYQPIEDNEIAHQMLNLIMTMATSKSKGPETFFNMPEIKLLMRKFKIDRSMDLINSFLQTSMPSYIRVQYSMTATPQG